jgi:outer membrane murein-binding lipoprotein Lpp
MKKLTLLIAIISVYVIVGCASTMSSDYLSKDTYLISSSADEFAYNNTDLCFKYMAALTTKRAGKNFFRIVNSKEK